MRVYLAGPMSGYPDHNRPAFEEAARKLRATGNWVLNPAELDEEDGDDHDWSYYLRRDLAVFLDPERDIHAVVVLKGWEESRGARLEVANAQALDIPVYTYDDGFLGAQVAPTGGVLAVQREWNQREAEEAAPVYEGSESIGAAEYRWDSPLISTAQSDEDPEPVYIPGTLDIRRPDGTVDRFADRNRIKVDGDEHRITDPVTGGQKGQKLARLGDLDPVALLSVAEVAGFGAAKYERHNFLKGYEWSLTYDAGQRHRLAFWRGEGVDPESGLPHLAHSAWHDLALLAFYLRGIGTDTRPPAA